MALEQLLQFVPTFVLAFFRIAGVMLVAPLFGSARISRRVKLLFALILALGVVPALGPAVLPDSIWQLTGGIAGELIFGLAIGTAVGFTFVAVQWAGEIIGQQMGLGIGEVYDPQFGAGSVVGDLYFMLAMVIFLVIGGHRILLRGLMASFDTLPLLSIQMDRTLFDLVVGLLTSATTLALQLSAPTIVAMLITDVVLGFLSKTVPQINVMTAGLSLRAIVGMVVLILGMMLTSEVIRHSLLDGMKQIAVTVGY